MFSLRCTQKLLGRLGASPALQTPPPDTVLGGWYANLLHVGRTQWVIAISERTGLPVVVPAREGRTLVRRITEALSPLLLSVGVPPEDVAAELAAMQSATLAKTASRQPPAASRQPPAASRRVLGSLNELAVHLEAGLIHRPERTLLAQSLHLAGTPMKLVDRGVPADATVAAFAARRVLGRIMA